MPLTIFYISRSDSPSVYACAIRMRGAYNRSRALALNQSTHAQCIKMGGPSTTAQDEPRDESVTWDHAPLPVPFKGCISDVLTNCRGSIIYLAMYAIAAIFFVAHVVSASGKENVYFSLIISGGS